MDYIFSWNNHKDRLSDGIINVHLFHHRVNLIDYSKASLVHHRVNLLIIPKQTYSTTESILMIIPKQTYSITESIFMIIPKRNNHKDWLSGGISLL
jgi:hypothetical protein